MADQEGRMVEPVAPPTLKCHRCFGESGGFCLVDLSPPRFRNGGITPSLFGPAARLCVTCAIQLGQELALFVDGTR